MTKGLDGYMDRMVVKRKPTRTDLARFCSIQDGEVDARVNKDGESLTLSVRLNASDGNGKYMIIYMNVNVPLALMSTTGHIYLED